MILFPNAKINLGLFVTSTLPNGYHTIETVMAPIGWHDILEIVPGHSLTTTLNVSGREIDCPVEKNLVYKAWKLMDDCYGVGPVDIYLHKIIPDGAGLGGGSSDAAFTLKALDSIFNLQLSDARLAELALRLGADCPFFIYNKPMLATGIGEKLSQLSLSPFSGFVVVVKPSRSVSTAEAYRNVAVGQPVVQLGQLVDSPITQWLGRGVVNSFENSVARLLPEIAEIKQMLVDAGAVYASMSGSGSAVFGIFERDIMAQSAASMFGDCVVYCGQFSL